jgi:hypothetical protein
MDFVAQLCGDPDDIAQSKSTRCLGSTPYMTDCVDVYMEKWLYTATGKFPRILTFENGALVEITTGEYSR